MPKDLKIQFFTIVLNGMPFIEEHIETFKKITPQWHWHIIEGVAELKNDTAWSVANGGRIEESFHKYGLSNDGTTEYLDLLKEQYPDRITIYRKPKGDFWNGKIEMVNAPLQRLKKNLCFGKLMSMSFGLPHKLIRPINFSLTTQISFQPFTGATTL